MPDGRVAITWCRFLFRVTHLLRFAKVWDFDFSGRGSSGVLTFNLQLSTVNLRPYLRPYLLPSLIPQFSASAGTRVRRFFSVPGRVSRKESAWRDINHSAASGS